jgi:hypothetical protein
LQWYAEKSLVIPPEVNYAKKARVGFKAVGTVELFANGRLPIFSLALSVQLDRDSKRQTKGSSEVYRTSTGSRVQYTKSSGFVLLRVISWIVITF